MENKVAIRIHFPAAFPLLNSTLMALNPKQTSYRQKKKNQRKNQSFSQKCI